MSDPSPGPASWRDWARRVWPVAKWLVGLGLAVLAFWVLTGRRGELSEASTYLGQLRWGWLIPLATVELGSLLCFAAMTQVILRAGGVRIGLGPLSAITLVGTTITNSLPVGPVVSTVFTYQQFRRRGADEVLTGFALAAIFVGASVSLALLAGAGAVVAGSEGATLDLVVPIVGVLVATLLVGVMFVHQRWLVRSLTALVGFSSRVARWPRGDSLRRIDEGIARLTSVRLSATSALVATGLGLANWLLDCSCLALAFPSLGLAIPWKGLLLAYGAGQLAANLPITPGGLGVVEGSLTIALVAFGGGQSSTVAAVLLYRILSFWVELPIGWAFWAFLVWSGRRLVAPEVPNETESTQPAGVAVQ